MSKLREEDILKKGAVLKASILDPKTTKDLISATRAEQERIQKLKHIDREQLESTITI